MPEKSQRTPSYRLHKSSGQARVIIGGEHIYLGKYGTRESRQKYHRLVAEWLATRQPAAGAGATSVKETLVTINELILAFWQHVRKRYVKHGVPTSEQRSYRTALRPVRRLYGETPANDFGPLALVACRQESITAGICRKRINQHVTRIRRMFKWGVAHELVPETTWRALCAVEGLRVGEAVETEPIKPVPEEHIAPIEPFVTPQIWAMVSLQLWSACRPGEACVLRAIDINMQGKIWEYRPHTHKGEHYEKDRVIYLGPHAQKIVKPWLKSDLYTYLFSPRKASAWFQTQHAMNRRTPKSKRPRASQRKRNPKRAPGSRYATHAYDQAIARACKRAGIPNWAPNQLRHNAATRIRAAYGVEAARIILGHSSVATSEIYAEIDQERAGEIVGELG